MPLPITNVHYLGTVHSPFSGQAADTEDGSNTSDTTLLFVHYGDATIWDYISPRVLDQLPDDAGDPEDLDPEGLAALLDIDGGMVMVVDTDRNGVNHYGFAPGEDK